MCTPLCATAQRMADLEKELHEERQLRIMTCRQRDEADRVCDEEVARSKLLEAENARLRAAAQLLLQHEASAFWGEDAEKNRRRSYKGVIRKVRAALASPTQKEARDAG